MDVEIGLRDSPRSESGLPLTSFECDVLAVSATGRGVDDVAAFLGQPADEIRKALGTVIIKLGARSKLEAVLIARRAGLIELPEPASGRDPHGGNDAGIG